MELPVRLVAASPNGAWCQPIEYGKDRSNSRSYAPQQPDQDLGQRVPAGRSSRSGRRRAAGSGDQQRLVWPGGPERDDRQPVIVLVDDPRAAGFLGHVVEQHRPAVGGAATRAGCRPRGRPCAAAPCPPRSGRGDGGCDGAHHLAAVLEDLDPLVAARRAPRSGPPRGPRPGGPPARRHRRERQVVAAARSTMTRQVPALDLRVQQSLVDPRSGGTSGRSAAKSFVKTNVSA